MEGAAFNRERKYHCCLSFGP